MGRKKNSHKRAASVQPQEGCPPAKKVNAPAEAQEISVVDQEMNLNLRTTLKESANPYQYFCQATALPKNLPKMLDKIEEVITTIVRPGKQLPIFVKYGAAGSDEFKSSIKTNKDKLRDDLDIIIDEINQHLPNEEATIIVLIYHTRRNREDEEIQALSSTLRDDLPARPPVEETGSLEQQPMKIAVEQMRLEVESLKEKIREARNYGATWWERAICEEKRVESLKDQLVEKDIAIAVLDGGIPDPEISKLKAEIRKQKQQRDEAIRERDEAVQERKTLQQHEREKEADGLRKVILKHDEDRARLLDVIKEQNNDLEELRDIPSKRDIRVLQRDEENRIMADNLFKHRKEVVNLREIRREDQEKNALLAFVVREQGIKIVELKQDLEATREELEIAEVKLELEAKRRHCREMIDEKYEALRMRMEDERQDELDAFNGLRMKKDEEAE